METPTLFEFLQCMEKQMAITAHFNLEEQDSLSIEEFYPSVDFGSINITKAITELDWRPTAMDIAMRLTCEFYKSAWHLYPQNRPTDYFSDEIVKFLEKH
jgi:hypothetical protein